VTIDSVTSLHPTHTKSAVADCRSPTHRRPLSPISKHHWDASNPPELDRIVRSLPVGTEAVKQNVWPRWQTRRWRFGARGSLKIATNRRWQLIVSGLFLEPESLSHWLPVQSRVEFKIACLARKSLTSTAPTYSTYLPTFNSSLSMVVVISAHLPIHRVLVT